VEILIYAVIAAILVYRLYTMLGQRDGNEQSRPAWKRSNPFATKNDPHDSKDGTPNKDDLLALPLAQPKQDAPQTQPQPQYGIQPQALPGQPFAVQPALESLAGAIFAIQKADPNFDERGFLKGARLAFEIIVRAFAAGERGTLKNLLAPPLYVAFENAISARELQGERWEMKTVTIRDMDVIAAHLDGSIALVTVQCVSDQSKMVYDKNGAVLKDPGNQIERLTDIWTLRRDTKSNNPNWQLAETRSV
jgi:predicted lipid-binding transport protein (Tim44 family)